MRVGGTGEREREIRSYFYVTFSLNCYEMCWDEIRVFWKNAELCKFRIRARMWIRAPSRDTCIVFEMIVTIYMMPGALISTYISIRALGKFHIPGGNKIKGQPFFEARKLLNYVYYVY